MPGRRGNLLLYRSFCSGSNTSFPFRFPVAHDPAPSKAAARPRRRRAPRERHDAGRAPRHHRPRRGIFGLRMLGMFIVLPVLALYAETLRAGATIRWSARARRLRIDAGRSPVPFGWASDRLGRKPVIVAGLVVFALGSFIAAWAPNDRLDIVGRTCRAPARFLPAVIALTSDLTARRGANARHGRDRQ